MVSAKHLKCVCRLIACLRRNIRQLNLPHLRGYEEYSALYGHIPIPITHKRVYIHSHILSQPCHETLLPTYVTLVTSTIYLHITTDRQNTGHLSFKVISRLDNLRPRPNIVDEG